MDRRLDEGVFGDDGVDHFQSAAAQAVIPDRYVWFVWSTAFLVAWVAVFVVFPRQRQVMTWASVLTAPLGLTEPLFVPDYWSPPSLFDLARTTGFDIESLIFSFGMGGVGAVIYDLLTGRELTTVVDVERHSSRHRWHGWALIAPFASFPILYSLRWNPIYPAIAALLIGAVAAVLCRPDLIRKTCVGAVLFTVYYSVFLTGIEWTAPGYIGRVWNLGALSGLSVGGLPMEELVFAAAFGAYWSGIYEHVTWRALARCAGPD